MLELKASFLMFFDCFRLLPDDFSGETMTNTLFSCRPHCAACCIAPSISSPIPGMANGKPAGIRCCQLTDDNRCRLFGQKERPDVCGSLQSSLEMCGENQAQAMAFLTRLELDTAPSSFAADSLS